MFWRARGGRSGRKLKYHASGYLLGRGEHLRRSARSLGRPDLYRGGRGTRVKVRAWKNLTGAADVLGATSATNAHNVNDAADKLMVPGTAVNVNCN